MLASSLYAGSLACHWSNTSKVSKLGVELCFTTDDNYARFWKSYPSFETDMFSSFSRYVHASTIVLDIGAWIGLTTLYLASRARLVVSIEPSRAACRYLRRLIRLNSLGQRVHLMNAALGSFDGPVFFTGDGDSMDYQLGLAVVKGLSALASVSHLYPDLNLSRACTLVSPTSLSDSLIGTHMLDMVQQLPFKSLVRLSEAACVTWARSTDSLLVMDPRSAAVVSFLSKMEDNTLDPSLRGLVQTMPFGRKRLTRHSGRYLSMVQSLSARKLLKAAPELSYVGFVKLDAEGAELTVLHELEPLLQQARPVLWISIHVSMIGVDAARALVSDPTDFSVRLGS